MEEWHYSNLSVWLLWVTHRSIMRNIKRSHVVYILLLFFTCLILIHNYLVTFFALQKPQDSLVFCVSRHLALIFTASEKAQSCKNSTKTTTTASLSKHIQGAPIKNNLLGKIHYPSYCNRFFFIKFTAFTEEDSGHISSKFCWNICYCVKITTI